MWFNIRLCLFFITLHQMIGAAEAAAIEAIGKAEAERMRQKAAAYKQYGDAALMSLILEAMPKVKHYTIRKISFLILVSFLKRSEL